MTSLITALLCVFCGSLKGVPLAYDNIRILGPYGGIINDSGYIHMDVVADFIVFQPQKGQKLMVRVTVLSLVLVLFSYFWGIWNHNCLLNKKKPKTQNMCQIINNTM